MSIFHVYFETTTKHRMSCLEISVPKKEKSQTKQIHFCVSFKRSLHSKETIALTLLSQAKSLFKRHREPLYQKQRGREGGQGANYKKKMTIF